MSAQPSAQAQEWRSQGSIAESAISSMTCMAEAICAACELDITGPIATPRAINRKNALLNVPAIISDRSTHPSSDTIEAKDSPAKMGSAMELPPKPEGTYVRPTNNKFCCPDDRRTVLVKPSAAPTE